jgi:hypothetical protein
MTVPPTLRAISDGETPGFTWNKTSPSTKGAAPSADGGGAAAEIGVDASIRTTRVNPSSLKTLLFVMLSLLVCVCMMV